MENFFNVSKVLIWRGKLPLMMIIILTSYHYSFTQYACYCTFSINLPNSQNPHTCYEVGQSTDNEWFICQGQSVNLTAYMKCTETGQPTLYSYQNGYNWRIRNTVTNDIVFVTVQNGSEFANYTFNQAGRYEISNSTAINSQECSASPYTYTMYVNVMSTTPTFKAEPTNCDRLYSFNFNFPQFASPCSTNIVTPSVTWNFGDGIIATYSGANFNTPITGVANTTGTFLNPVHTFPPNYGTTYTVTATVNNGYCGDNSANQSITIRQPVTASINSGNDQCAGSALSLSALHNVIGAVGYLWSGTGITLPANATQSITYPTPPGSYTYNVTVTDGRNCTGTASKQINSIGCCNSPGTITYNAITAEGLLFNLLDNNVIPVQDYLSGTIQNIPIQFIFNGLITMDRNITFLNCPNITFGQNGGIVTNGHTLTVTNSVLYACGPVMWKGIQINHANGFANVNQSEIREAERALWSTNAGKITCTNSKLFSNWVSVRVDQFTPTFQITRTIIDGQTAPLRTTSLNTFGSNKGDVGIELNNVQGTSQLLIGSNPANDADRNTFRRLNCGVRATNSRLRIDNNTFFQINSNNGLDYHGKMIFNRTPNNVTGLPFTNFELYVGNASIANANYLYEGTTGIDHSGVAHVDIRNNRFAEPNPFATGSAGFATGLIRIASNTNRNINVMNNFSRGISNIGYWIDNCPGSNIQITGNDLHFIVPTQPSAYEFYGIFANNYNPNGTGNFIRIENNSVRRAHFGISTNNTINSRIINNSVSIQPQDYGSNFSTCTWIGINTSSDNNNRIERNFIRLEPGATLPTFNNSASTSRKVIGISTMLSQSITNVVCDSVVGVHIGLAGIGANAGGVPIATSTFENCRTGVALITANSTIGNQGFTIPAWNLHRTNDNRFINCTNHLGSYGANASGQTWFLRNPDPTGGLMNPITNCSNPLNPGLIQEAIGAPPTSPFAAQCLTPNLNYAGCAYLTNRRSGDEDIEGLDIGWYEKVAQDSLEFSEFEIENRLWSKTQLYNLLSAYPDLLFVSPILDTFFTNRTNTAFAQLDEVKKAAGEAETSTEQTALLTENAGVKPENTHEQNQQAVNQLQLKYFSVGNLAFSKTDSLLLRSIAGQCYLTGGPAVLQARSMYFSLIGTVDNSFAENCIAQTGSFKKEQEQKKLLPIAAKLYPNPLNTSILNVELPQSGTLEVISVIGQLISKSNVSEGLNEMNLSNISKGNYIVKTTYTNGEIDIQKLTVTK